MDDIDDMMIHTQLSEGVDEADCKEQQLNLITKPFQNLNLVYEHDMMVTEQPHNEIPHIRLVSKHPDPCFGVPVTLQKDVWMKRQTPPNNKTRLSHDMIPIQLETAILHGTSQVPPVGQVRKHHPKVVIGYRVPMTTGQEKYIWKKFQKLAETHKWSERQGVWNPRDQVKVDLRHPIVRYLASFAVQTYNAVCVKAGVSWGVVMTSVLKFKYIAIQGIYANYITLAATDNGVRCVYSALVQTLPSDGSKTLITFSIPPGYGPFDKKKHEGAAEKSELLKQGQQNDRKGKKKAYDFSFKFSLDMMKKPKEVAAWDEMVEQRFKALKAPPSGSGLSRCTTIGNYSYWIPLKEFKNVKY